MKRCRDCREFKPESEFHKTGGGKHLQAHCKPCNSARTRAWRARNPEAVRANKREWLAKNPDKVAAMRAKQNERSRVDPERIAYRRAWQEANRDRVRANQRASRARTRWQRIETQYGITQADYEAMVRRQDGRCPICHRGLDEVRIHIDHCHDTGRVRGLLCSRCNQALGLLGERAENAARAADYLSV